MAASVQILPPPVQFAGLPGAIPAAIATEPLLVMDDLLVTAPQHHQIAFYEASQVVNLPMIHRSWIDSMRMMGFNIDHLSGFQSFDNYLENGNRPKIVALSVLTSTLYLLPLLISQIRKKVPDATIIAGGLGVVPELARFIDVAVLGEGDIILPILFKAIIDQSAIKDLKAKRTIAGPDGRLFDIDAPFGKKIAVRAGDGFEFGNDSPLEERYAQDRNRWREMFDDAPFPLGLQEYAKASSPIPIGSRELDKLFLGSLEFVGKAVSHGRLQLYANRGCFGSCLFCSLNSGNGMRRPSVDRIMDVISAAERKGINWIRFGDELFVQSRQWVNELLDRIEAKGYHKKIEFWAQTRADTLDEELVKNLMRMNFKFAMGVETLLPYRAEFINKVTPGKGERYVNKAKAIIRLMMTAPTGGRSENTAAFILAFRGEGPRDVIKELKAQLEFLIELHDEFGRLPYFSYNPVQIPTSGDTFDISSTGHANYQPSSIFVPEHEENNWLIVGVDVGETDGHFLIFQSGAVANGFKLDGIYTPDRFKWPEDMRLLNKFRSFDPSNKPWKTLKTVFDVLPKPNDSLGDEYRENWTAVSSLLKIFIEHEEAEVHAAMR